MGVPDVGSGRPACVYAIAAGLIELGVRPEQRVALASTTRLEWILADLGIMCAGAVTTTVYPQTNADECAYILSDSDSRVLIAENPPNWPRPARSRRSCPDLRMSSSSTRPSPTSPTSGSSPSRSWKSVAPRIWTRTQV